MQRQQPFKSPGKVLGESAQCKIARRLESLILEPGGYGTAKAIAKKLINRPIFKRLLPHVATENETVKKASDAIIKAARGFLKDIMITRGRRSAVDSNAFWVAATALIPADVLANRQGRATMRLLGVNESVVHKAVELRERAERDKKWEPIVAKKRKRLDPSPLIEWWHSEGSVPDNSRKIEVKVGGGIKHPLRYQDGLTGELRQRFLKSPQYKTMNDAYRQKFVAIREKRARAELAKSLGQYTDEDLNAKMSELGEEYMQKEICRREALATEAAAHADDARLHRKLLNKIPTFKIGK